MKSNNYLTILSLIYLFQAFSFSSLALEHNYTGADITKVTPIGHQYALWKGPSHRDRVLYDLSWPRRARGKKFIRTILSTATLGFIDFISAVRIFRRNKRKLVSREFVKNLKENYGIEISTAELNHQIENIMNSAECKSITLPQNWWKKYNWIRPPKVSTTKDLDQMIEFQLNDLNLNKLLGRNRGKFYKNWNKLVWRLRQLGHDPMKFDHPDKIFKTMSVEVKNNKALVLYSHATDEGGEDHIVKSNPNINYAKNVIDLRRDQGRFYKRLLNFSLPKIIQGLSSLIPGNVGGRILSYAFERWWRLYFQQAEFHAFQVLEAINASYIDQSDRDLIFSGFPQGELKRLALGLFAPLHRDFTDLFRRKGVRFWLGQMRRMRNRSERRKSWLKINTYEETPLNHYFSIVKHKGKNEHALAMLGIQSISGTTGLQSFVAIDYNNPHRIIKERLALENIYFVLSVAEFPIPLLGGILKILYYELVLRDLRWALNHEAQLVGHLKYLQHYKRQNWEKELTILYEQRLNPLELNYEEEKAFLRDMH